MLFQSAYFLYIVIVKPHEDPTSDKLEILNESLFMLLGYAMFGFVSTTLLNQEVLWYAAYLFVAGFLTIFVCNYHHLIRGVIIKIKMLLFKRKRKTIV